MQQQRLNYKKMPSTDRQNIVADNSGIIIPEDEDERSGKDQKH